MARLQRRRFEEADDVRVVPRGRIDVVELELGPGEVFDIPPGHDVASRHNEIAERIVDRFGGRLVKTTGDGIIALFDSAESAVRAAAALNDGLADLDLAIRTAVHSGEVELGRDDGIRGSRDVRTEGPARPAPALSAETAGAL